MIRLNQYKSKVILFLILIISSSINLVHANDEHFELMVSTSSYNRLVFPVPFMQIVMPPNAQLAEDPVMLQNNHGLLIKPAQGARPITLFVQLVDGSSFNIKLIPSSNPDGAVFRYKNATDKNNKPEIAHRPNDSWITDLFVTTFMNKEPVGFEVRKNTLIPTKLLFASMTGKKSNAKKLNQLDLIPLALYENSSYKLKVYQLKSKQPTHIEPRDFYHDKVVAISLESDLVSYKQNPKLILLEYANE